jgi:putative hemolysin
MSHAAESPDQVIALPRPWPGPLRGAAFALVAPMLERALALDALRREYRALVGLPARDFLERALLALGVDVDVEARDCARIPVAGPLVVVANHPFGGLEGIALTRVLLQVRPDVKVMANAMLGKIPELRDLFVFVDPFQGPGAAQANVRGLRLAAGHLRAGGALLVFPAGEVASLDVRRGVIADPPWNPAAARLAHRVGASVLPVYVDGANGAAFHALGFVHPRLRTALLPRELLNKRAHRLKLRIGTPIASARLAAIGDEAESTELLRQRTMLLRHRVASPARPAGPGGRLEEIASPVDEGQLGDEVAALAPEQRLVESGEFVVYCAGAAQIPSLLNEIGRLREIAFRTVGEGTGRARDLDGFDPHYLHLFVWHRRRCQVIGAYRLGPTDVILSLLGPRGLYTTTLFKFGPGVLDGLGPALELGRSFVRPEHQRSFEPLLMLWRGIGEFVARRPKYCRLFGPVSISQSYAPLSQRLIVDFLRARPGDGESPGLVRARRPFRAPRPRGLDLARVVRQLRDTGELSELIAELEADGKGLPVLLRQYLKLGGRILEFNVDRDFAGVVDGLVLVDLRRTDRRLLERYLGREGSAAFVAFHAESPARAWRGEAAAT